MATRSSKIVGFGLGLGFLWLAGCSVANEGPGAPDEGVGQTERRELRLTKSKLPGSCQTKSGAKFCGGKSFKGACWCDAACAQYGDCCADVDAVCNVIPVGGECAAGACGPALGMPIKLCSDGVHTSGPTGKCLKNADGTCGWEIASCPPAGQFCGGIANFLCPEGKTCVDNPDDDCDPNNGGADCGGICVDAPPPPAKEFCGGFANIQCPAGKTCVDDPNDGCDPKNGGADCGGICVDAPPAPPENSCVDHCGGVAADKSCYCDSLCQGFGDCCSDFAAACAARTKVSGGCAKSSDETCSTDADCTSGGCGGELCYNPAFGGGISTCECTAPTSVAGCGCVSGKCSWYK